MFKNKWLKNSKIMNELIIYDLLIYFINVFVRTKDTEVPHKHYHILFLFNLFPFPKRLLMESFSEMFVLLSDIKSCANYVVIIWIWSPRRSNDMTHNMSVLEWLWMSWKLLHEFDVLSLLLLLLWFREEAEPCADMKDWISWFSFRDIFSLAEGVPDWSKVLSSNTVESRQSASFFCREHNND